MQFADLGSVVPVVVYCVLYSCAGTRPLCALALPWQLRADGSASSSGWPGSVGCCSAYGSREELQTAAADCASSRTKEFLRVDVILWEARPQREGPQTMWPSASEEICRSAWTVSPRRRYICSGVSSLESMTCVKDPDADLDKTSNQGQSQTAEREIDMNTLSYGMDAFKDYIPLKFRMARSWKGAGPSRIARAC